ncbi:uncharacterized protein EDB93DRAFT_1255850 [Suillus bovinus]|uniref:uncharacterized protein n=1 Tax=Suillus bovinus TaxID=48563 RepID=UPI001B8709D0|nr:uncharacterized protein EDB93DRAFT_1255850 [Suillus bovinus]KAG2130447.1 hypothetical protein EDB93DRAFT_1255850 [Suillus bovinus]
MEMLPPPDETPGHDNRTITIGAARLLTAPSKHRLFWNFDDIILNDTGDLVEQHPDIAHTLLLISVLPLIVTREPTSPLIWIWTTRTNQRWNRGMVSTWIFSGTIPNGSQFSMLQRLAMIDTKLQVSLKLFEL